MKTMGVSDHKAAAAALAQAMSLNSDAVQSRSSRSNGTRSAKTVKSPSRATAAPRKPPEVNSTTVREWFDEAIRTHILPMHQEPFWGTAERSMAKQLLTKYGPDLTRAAVFRLCETWLAMVARSRSEYIRGIPTIRVLMRLRDSIFGEVILAAAGVSAAPKSSAEREREAALRGEFRDETGNVNVPKIKSW
jgi:hypothetical protein